MSLMFTLFAGSIVMMALVLVLVALSSGGSVAAGERGVLYAAVAYVVIAVIAVSAFGYLHEATTRVASILAIGLFTLMEVLALLVMGFATLIVMNR